MTRNCFDCFDLDIAGLKGWNRPLWTKLTIMMKYILNLIVWNPCYWKPKQRCKSPTKNRFHRTLINKIRPHNIYFDLSHIFSIKIKDQRFPNKPIITKHLILSIWFSYWHIFHRVRICFSSHNAGGKINFHSCGNDTIKHSYEAIVFQFHISTQMGIRNCSFQSKGKSPA